MVNCESDLGKHQDNCDKPKMSKEDRHKIKKAIKKVFGDDYSISERHMQYFDTFWQAFDNWLKEYLKNDPKTKEYKKNIKIIKYFLYGHDYPKDTRPKLNLIQSEEDKKQFEKCYGNHNYLNFL